jgi:hypothetical protein
MKIQYFGTDLSNALGIGEIHDMKVELVNNVQVLRIDCESEKLCYKTVRVNKPKGKSSKPSKSSKSKPEKKKGLLASFMSPRKSINEPPPKRSNFDDMGDRFKPPF